MAGEARQSLVDARYRIVEPIGQGGMASVERAVDTRTGALVALKRLLRQDDPERWSRMVDLFEREYHQLSQMAHPCVVTVYDYGHDDGAPYYTMELLDGGDLSAHAPLDWRTTCAIALDVCSALSLVHSRRLVHRDLGPRNVRWTENRTAKLIDFGAMAPMGTSRNIVGTPPICAPEIVRFQPMDGRTDLYALGATLYSTLTRRMPYPTKSFKALERMWQNPLPPPSAHVEDVPPALDRLVLDLLQLDMSARPANASEVMQRLCAIASLELGEQHQVSQAFLSTPRLIGRDNVLKRLRCEFDRLKRNKGTAIRVTGPAGIGRSRLLDACALEARLAGATVVRADMADATGEDWEVALAMASRLIDAVPGATRRAAAGASEQFRRFVEGDIESNELALEPTLQQQLRAWIQGVCEQCPVLLVVDDVQRADSQSIALLAALAQDIADLSLMLVTSVPSDAASSSLPEKALAQASNVIELARLTPVETEALLRSVFGDVPHIELLAKKLRELSRGHPRDLMLLAQHMLDKDLVRYDAGAWSLPSRIDAGDLPRSLALAMEERLARLGADARRLSYAMALCDAPRFTYDECMQLSGHRDAARLIRSLDELSASGIVVQVGSDYALGSQAWISALRTHHEHDDSRELHRSLAGMYRQRDDGFRVAQHLFHAGDDDRGMEALLQFTIESQRRTDRDPEAYVELLWGLPADWLAVYEHALQTCDRLARPPMDSFVLRRRLISITVYDDSIGNTQRHFISLCEQLSRNCGLDVYTTLDDTLAPAERLDRALAIAQQRHASLPEPERLFEPVVAAGELVRVMQSAVAVVAGNLDLAFLRMLPSLAPLAPLSPACEMLHMILEGLELRLSARTEQARDTYLAALEGIRAADEGGLKGTFKSAAETGLMYLLCNMEAGMGLSSALEWGQQIQADPLHVSNGYLGQALYYLWQGDFQTAARLRARSERVLLEHNQRRAHGEAHLLLELPAYALADDLTRVGHLVNRVSELAQQRAGWKPVLHYARGERARIRGDYETALKELEIVLELVSAGTHQIWPYAAGAHVHVLCALERYAQARHEAEAHLDAARAAGLGYTKQYVRMPLSIAYSRLGETEIAQREADEVIQEFLSMGTTGLNLFLAYEARAIVALAEDPAVYERLCARARDQLPEEGSDVLAAKYQRLLRLGDSWNSAAEEYVSEEVVRTLTLLRASVSPEDLARRALMLILEECGGSQGFLYVAEDSQIKLVARQADHNLSSSIEAQLQQYAGRELAELEETRTTGVPSQDLTPGASTEAELAWTCEKGRSYKPMLLATPSDQESRIHGIAVILTEPATQICYPIRAVRCLAQVGGL